MANQPGARVETAKGKVFGQYLPMLRRFFDKIHARGPPRPSLESKGSTSCKQVEDHCPRDLCRQPIEEALPNDPRGWPQGVAARSA